MRLDQSWLFSHDQTGRKMYKWVRLFYADLGGLLDYSLYDFFNLVSNIKFVEDLPEFELLARPEILLKYFSAMDCKKKSLLIASWLHGQDPPVPFRFVAISENPEEPQEPHHVFTQALLSPHSGSPDIWVNIDNFWVNFIIIILIKNLSPRRSLIIFIDMKFFVSIDFFIIF